MNTVLLNPNTATENAKPFFYKKGSAGVLLIHGFTSTPYILQELGKSLAELGYTVYAPLIAGHGTHPDDLAATNWQDWCDSVEAAYLELSKECDQIYVIGVSLGSNLAAALATKQKIAGLVMIASPRWIYRHGIIDLGSQLAHRLGVRYYYKNTYKKHSPDTILGGETHSYLKVPLKSIRESFYFVDKVMQEILPKVKVPTLIIQSKNDGFVHPKSAEFVYKYLGTDDKAIHWVKDRHSNIPGGEKKDDILNFITNFLNKHRSSKNLQK